MYACIDCMLLTVTVLKICVGNVKAKGIGSCQLS